jgi:hypothetical protein
MQNTPQEGMSAVDLSVERQLINKMADVLIRVPIFHRCGFPNAANFDKCLSCATDAVLMEFNALNSPDREENV